MTKTAQDIIAGVEVLTIVTECYGGGGPGGTDKRGETKMTVLVGESGAMSIINAINAAGFVIVSNDALDETPLGGPSVMLVQDQPRC